MDQTGSERNARARWRSRRGMLELDFFLVRFSEEAFPQLSEALQADYFRLLECEDVDIHRWLTARDVPADASLREIVTCVRTHAAHPCT